MNKVKFNKESLQNFLLNYALYIVLFIMIVFFVIKEPGFLSLKNFTNILSQASTRGILALGVAGLIVLQGTDLSAGRILGFTAIISASLLQSTTYAARMYPDLPALPLILPMLLAIVIGGIFGAINGFGVAKLKVHAFIITLGTQLIAYGASCLYIDRPPLGAQPVANLDERYTRFVNGYLKLGSVEIPYLVFYLAIVAAIMWFVWNKTKLGKNMFAIGGNPEAAAVSGVNLVKNIMIIFIISGVLYGLAGFLEAARAGSTTTSTGFNYELDAISACVVGGVSFTGGIGTIPGVLIGTVLLQVINYGLNFIGVNAYWQYIIRGLIIIVAVSLDVRKYIAKK
ncbi:galactose/methyl galactoside ABC transporter permease MglC [Clostridium tertium]|jgi:methyl-galactoside transport system permease protein|uniref:galactose/methyl galactoside ABC transporter permease MglC n=1 Tax=Clostridium TaxID=1485 RepID=UPI00115BEC7F|nr:MULTISPECIES: galactose/methyl galactoside ABC transporter permease MglC [Clostridium]MBS5308024.1 galactose/methyl galactoside ABC transporter permease MglC [Clostridium sp.]MDB1921345.1 galactose/methyl galactoside ABC transporter permease MglC [Clostridium tertium]MDB1924590.1 galactose/methyl galactoside ABC transporter permease MglC [Clostridium tertium]MDB1928119.1 galactose/methyl galactoside ABC transporter permease MglC [Clostridium tertium]MDB1933575.1 galactose/methyl galactoside